MDLVSFRHLALGDVDSTNSEAVRLARSGEASGLWITADRQLGGRGRRGRTWVSEPGNLYASLMLINPAPVDQMGSLPLAVAIGVHEALCRVLPDGSVAASIKWPNDILIDGAKVAGILIESENLPDGRRLVVIGCGVNLGHRPDMGPGTGQVALPYRVTSLGECGSPASPQTLFAHLFATMADVLMRWDRGAGIAAIREDWLSRASGIGSPVTVKLPDRELHGLFEGIDAEGRLVLVSDDGRNHAIAAGDVFLAEAHMSRQEHS